jgi:NAD(P)-dependent dehydrogenase (short-subunit alcohol dehydrogenase family)
LTELTPFLQINVKGSYNLAHAFLPTKKPGSTIIGFSTGLAFLPANLPFMAKASAYSASKLALARLFEYLASENKDITVFNLHPGIVRTELYEKSELQLDNTLDTRKSTV